LHEVALGVGVLPQLGDVAVSRLLAGLDLGVLGPLLLELGHLVLDGLEAAVDVEVALALDLGQLLLELGLEVGKVGVTLLVVDPGDEVGGEVDDLLELLGLQLLTGLGAHEQVGQPRAGAAEIPDVHDRRGQLDVAHALAPHLRARDLDAAPLADDALEADALVLAAVALPVLGGTEDLLAEEPVLLRLQGAVVDGLRLLDLAVRPRADRVGGRETDAELVEIVDVEHLLALSPRNDLHAGARPLRPTLVPDGRGRCRAPRWYGRCPRRAPASRSPRPSWTGPPRSDRGTASP